MFIAALVVGPKLVTWIEELVRPRIRNVFTWGGGVECHLVVISLID